MREERAQSRGYRLGLPVAGIVVAVGLWWATTAIFHIRSFFLPSPPDIVAAFADAPGSLFRETWATVSETLIGFLLAVVAGLLIAVALTASRTVERATLPLLVALNSIPKVAIAPLLVVWLGFGPEPKIVLVLL